MAARQMDHGMPAVVSPPAEIDLTNAQEVFDQIYVALEAALTTVIVDLTATTFCDSSGIRHLLLAHRKADSSGTQLRFAVPAASPVRRILAFTGADQVIAVYPTLGEAISGSLAPAQPGSPGGAAEEPPAQPMAKLCVLRRSHPRLRERRSAPASAAAARPIMAQDPEVNPGLIPESGQPAQEDTYPLGLSSDAGVRPCPRQIRIAAAQSNLRHGRVL